MNSRVDFQGVIIILVSLAFTLVIAAAVNSVAKGYAKKVECEALGGVYVDWNCLKKDVLLGVK